MNEFMIESPEKKAFIKHWHARSTGTLGIPSQEHVLPTPFCVTLPTALSSLPTVLASEPIKQSQMLFYQ